MAYIGTKPTVGNFVKLDTITTSATATYNLLSGGVAYSPQSANHCIVSLNGVIQSPTTSFTISGSTIVFASALTATDVIDFILVLGDVLNIGTPSDATVGFSKITSNLITGATAETSIAGGDSILIYDDSATALRKMTKTNLFSGVAVNAPTFRANAGTTTTLTANTFTKINFTTEDWDTNSNFASSRFTPTVAGYYQINAVFGEGLSTSGMQFYIEINKSGSRHALMQYITASAWYTNIPISSIVFCNGTTDYIEIFVLASSAYTNSTNTGTNYFEGAMIRSA